MRYMKILLKTIRQEKYFLNAYLLIFSYIWGAFVIVKQKYRKRMEIRGNEELEREQKLEKREYERIKKSWEEIGKDKEGEIMYLWRILFLYPLLGEMCCVS